MVDFKIDALMVIEEDEIKGIITIRSILNSTIEGHKTDETKVGVLVENQSLLFVRPNTSLEHAATLMKENDIKILPVISNDLEGFIYYEDLAEQRPELFIKRNPPNPTINYII
jgi:CBS domain-containing protein